jgi:hypothetical protein
MVKRKQDLTTNTIKLPTNKKSLKALGEMLLSYAKDESLLDTDSQAASVLSRDSESSGEDEVPEEKSSCSPIRKD